MGWRDGQGQQQGGFNAGGNFGNNYGAPTRQPPIQPPAGGWGQSARPPLMESPGMPSPGMSSSMSGDAAMPGMSGYGKPFDDTGGGYLRSDFTTMPVAPPAGGWPSGPDGRYTPPGMPSPTTPPPEQTLGSFVDDTRAPVPTQPIGAPPVTGGVKSPYGPNGPPSWNGGNQQTIGAERPPWAIEDLGNGTYRGPANAGSNNFARGPINGQTMGNPNNRRGPDFKAQQAAMRAGHNDPTGRGSIAERDPEQWARMQQVQAHNSAWDAWLKQQGIADPGVGNGGALLKRFYEENPQWAPKTGEGNLGFQGKGIAG